MPRAAAILVVGLGFLACETASKPTKPAAPSQPAASASSRRNLAPDPLSRRVRGETLRGAGEVRTSFSALEAAVRGSDRERSWKLYLQLREQYRRIEVEARLLAPVAASQLDPERAPPGIMLEGVGLRSLGDALGTIPPDWVRARQALSRTAGPARLLESELGAARWTPRRLAIALSNDAFDWGRMLDGSRAEYPEELVADIRGGATGLIRLARELSPAPDHALGRAAEMLESWARKYQEKPRRLLDGLLVTGDLGAAARARVAELGGRAIKAPFVPLHSSAEKPHLEPVSVATFPRLRGRPPEPGKVALGKRVFSHTGLSKNGKLSCQSCHIPAFALSGGPTRHRTVAGELLSRDAPGIWNTGFESAYFWDSRAASLDRQVNIAVERDLGGSWPDIVRTLNKDPELKKSFGQQFPGGITRKNIAAAVAEFERSLVRANTPFDRYVRGDRSALDGQLLDGFDLYYGKARCSRCHLLPLTSGTEPPTFRHVESSVIGVPKTAGGKIVDPDPGLGGVNGRAEHVGAFKVPTLRDLAVTAPYFHNGAYPTLAGVVDFYAEGSGPGLGMALPNFDPDAGPFELTASERGALIAFLERGLRHTDP